MSGFFVSRYFGFLTVRIQKKDMNIELKLLTKWKKWPLQWCIFRSDTGPSQGLKIRGGGAGSIVVGIICPLFEIGLTVRPKMGGGLAPQLPCLRQPWDRVFQKIASILNRALDKESIKGVSDLKASLDYCRRSGKNCENLFSCPNRTVLLTEKPV